MAKILCLLSLLTAMLLLLNSCALTDFLFGTGEETVSTGESEDITAGDGDVTAGPDDTGVSTDPGSVVTLSPSETTDTPAADTDPQTGEKVLYQDPLTGLWTETDYSGVRPVSIVLDNISAASPQSGISRADILIECMAEGGISRLIMITNKYSGSEVYGPVRSIRDYMVSLCQAFGTLMVGAGYSPTGYSTIFNYSLDYIDGTHDRYASSGFFRSPERYASSGYEHSLMITGTGIKALATHNNFSLVTASGQPVFNFVEKTVTSVIDTEETGSSAVDSSAVSSSAVGTEAQGQTVNVPQTVENEAIHTILTYSSYQQIQLIYSRSEDAYYRYQYGTKAHIDAENGQQLRFENVFILFAKQSVIPGDEEGRLSVQITGSGTGYYLTGGTYVPITWYRNSLTSSFAFANAEGNKLEVTPGKTFITVMDSAKNGTDAVVLNYRVEKSTSSQTAETTALPVETSSPEETVAQ